MGARPLLEPGGEGPSEEFEDMKVLLITEVKILQRPLERLKGLESWGGDYTEPGMDLILVSRGYVQSPRFPQVAYITAVENMRGYQIISEKIVESGSLRKKSREKVVESFSEPFLSVYLWWHLGST